MYSKFGQFIDGKWQPSSNNETYDVINPATEEIIGKASKATPADVDKALKSAQKGFNVWKKFSPWDRAAIIRKIAKDAIHVLAIERLANYLQILNGNGLIFCQF